MKSWILGITLSVLAAASHAADLLAPGQSLGPGQSLTSPNGEYTLVMQTDGNLVLYRYNSQVKWTANTHTKGGYKAVLNGTLQVLNSSGKKVWESYIHDHSPDDNNVNYLRVQDDGNAVVYGHTARWWNRYWQESDGQINSWRYIPSGTVMTPGTQYVNAGYRLIFQGDGNLVIYDPNNKALWHSKTQNKGGVRAVVQTDGNFVIYTANNVALWHTQTAGYPGSYLRLSAKGWLELMQPVARWGVFGVPQPRGPRQVINWESDADFNTAPIFTWPF